MNAPNSPLVAVAIPCFNQSKFLFDCLNSLLAQSEERWEAVVVDDCSTEGDAAAIVAGYGDPRIRSIRHGENRGLSAARNTAIAASAAPYVLPLDSDDFLDPEFLRATLEIMLHDKECDCVFTHLQLVGSSHDRWSLTAGTDDEMAVSQWAPGPGTLMRRAVWERAGGYCEAPELRAGEEDWDFHIAALESGARYRTVPRPLYFYRRHGGSLSVTKMRRENWKILQFIIGRHPVFFASRWRRRRFLSNGYVKGAEVLRMEGKRLQAGVMTLRAAWCRPPYGAELARSLAGKLRRALRETIRGRGRRAAASPVTEKMAVTREFWEERAAQVHFAYGHHSYDYRLLGELLRKFRPGTLLEIGCGSGRLLPVYLDAGIGDIEMEDISLNALELCRRRFAYQKGIRYSHRPDGLFARTEPVDLTVCNRVLQTLEEAELRTLLRQVCGVTKYFYLNELTDTQQGGGGPFSIGRDYDRLLGEFGMECLERGTVLPDQGEIQYWFLFGQASRPVSGPAGRVVPSA